ncbi:MAG: 3-oxoacyl-ACP synthase [Sandaracinus sp.]|nr:3-oxoacyl-ACP synthase [Sandaracinus sp.]|tara:strand:- start:1378 stop:2376 length:999 start_codon:yes stop_codon:yes gene_type:complete
MTRTAILGVGHYVPSKVVTNDDLAKMFDTSDEWIQQRTGIKERRFIEEEGIGPADLAVPAVKMACEKAGIEVSEIDAIIFATLSPDHEFPGSGCFLGDYLGLPGVPALDIRNQCSGFLYGLQIADAWIRCGMYERVALVGGEVHSTGIDLSDEGRDVAVLFGDGAACAILGPTEEEGRGVMDVEVHADGSGAKELWIEAPASKYIPRITHEMIDQRKVWPAMNGKQVFRWATSKMPEVARSVLERNGVGVADIDLLVPHQANRRINEFVAQKLELPTEKVVHNIHKYGNTTAASIPLALSEAMQEGRAKKGDLILMAAFGSGFTWGASLVRL